jgi:hypothetical protein
MDHLRHIPDDGTTSISQNAEYNSTRNTAQAKKHMINNLENLFSLSETA